MSLIQQALEKAGRDARESSVIQAEPQENLAEAVQEPLPDSLPLEKKAASRSSAWLFAMGFVGTFIVMTVLFVVWGQVQFWLPHNGNTLTLSNQRYRLSGITASGDRRLALINDRVLGLGEKIGHATVVKIHDSGATLELNGKKFELTLNM